MKDTEDQGGGGRSGDEGHKSSKLWTPYGDGGASEESEAAREPALESEADEEEIRRRVEEALEKLTIAQYLLDMAIELSSLAYMKMGLPPDVNAKFKDMEQAKLAIDAVDAVVNVLGPSVPEEALKALTGTVDNLKLNFAKES